MVSVPVRAGPVLAATVKSTVPLPLPLAPAAIVIHVSVVVAVHAQPLAEVTATLPAPPLNPNVWLVGLSDARHDPACETVNV
jgi:hypothetical protein